MIRPFVLFSAGFAALLPAVGACERGNPAASAPSAAVPPSGDAGAARGSAPAIPMADKLAASGLEFDVPAGWEKQAPTSAMRLAQFRLPAAAGDGELVVYYFGSGLGGTKEANVRRWVGQFSRSDGSEGEPPFESHSLKAGPLDLTVLRVSGTYRPGAMMPGAPPGQPRPGYAMFGLIVEGGPKGPLFAKATGPEATIRQHDAALMAFSRSVKVGQ